MKANISQWDAIHSGLRNRKSKVQKLELSDFSENDENFYKCFKMLPLVSKVELRNIEMSSSLWDKLYMAFSFDEVKTTEISLADILINEDNMKQLAGIAAKIPSVIFNNIEVVRKSKNLYTSMINCLNCLIAFLQ